MQHNTTARREIVTALNLPRTTPAGGFKTAQDVWAALDRGQQVFWGNTAYHITVEDHSTLPAEAISRYGWDTHFTNRGNKLLRVTCISNYFGSLLTEGELGKLFTE